MPTTYNDWLTISPTDAKSALVKVNTISDALDAGTPSLASLKREKGEKYAKAYLKAWIIYFQNLLNLKNKLNGDMIDFAVDEVFAHYWYITIADIKNVLTWALNGVYGEFYESLTIPKVVGWFSKYAEDRMDLCEQRSISNHYDIKNKPIVEEDLDRIKLQAKRNEKRNKI